MPEYHPFLEVDIGYAMATSGGFSSLTYRSGFDVSIPVFSPLAADLKGQNTGDRRWLVISSQPNIHEDFREIISEMASEHPRFLVLNGCTSNPLDIKIRCRDKEMYRFPEILLVYCYEKFSEAFVS